MNSTLQFFGDWGHVLCAGLFAGLTIWAGRRFAQSIIGKLLVVTLSLTSIWALSIAFGGVVRVESGAIESLRNCAWLVCLFMAPRYLFPGNMRDVRSALPLYVILLLLLFGQVGLELVAQAAAGQGAIVARTAEAAIILHVLWVIGALILVQRVYAGCDEDARRRLAPVALVMAAMWSYDLLLYLAAFLGDSGSTNLLFAMRGAAMAALTPAIALVLHSPSGQSFHASRALKWQGTKAVLALLGMFLLMASLFAIDMFASQAVQAVATGGLFALVAAGLLILPATRFRHYLRLLAAKHLFPHRYDYREQWMAFVDTIGNKGGEDDKATASIFRRVVKAMADITDSPAGALLMPGSDGEMHWHDGWNWRGEIPRECALSAELADRMRDRAWVIDVAQERAAGDRLPPWLHDDAAIWALVPILHYDALIAVIVLTRPPVMRPLDWEDFDMLRTAGRQVASYIAEARGEQALAEARRFEEFNRRFAFIMHDIKNLVSQIALVARNAERHADNPEFRADMVLTLKDCADRMNILLGRLSQHNTGTESTLAEFAVGDLARSVVAAKGTGHPVLLEGDLSLAITSDRIKLEQVISHLVQNAIEASEDQTPVLIRIAKDGAYARVEVRDYGCGMDARFIREELFRPFASTKQGGFGIGAYEARDLVRGLGGSLKVESAPGKGSVFTLSLPLSGKSAPEGDSQEKAA